MASIVQWLEYLPSKQVARVRFPVGAYLPYNEAMAQRQRVGFQTQRFRVQIPVASYILRVISPVVKIRGCQPRDPSSILG